MFTAKNRLLVLLATLTPNISSLVFLLRDACVSRPLSRSGGDPRGPLPSAALGSHRPKFALAGI